MKFICRDEVGEPVRRRNSSFIFVARPQISWNATKTGARLLPTLLQINDKLEYVFEWASFSQILCPIWYCRKIIAE